MIVTACLLLLVSCRHREKREAASEQPLPVPEMVVPSDTLPETVKDTVKQSVQSLIQKLHLDSAEVTNIRIFARKQKVIYSPSLLVGEWLRGTEHEVFREDHTGLLWEPSDDVSREEAQPFTWSLDSNMLILVFKLERGAVVPKMYVVTYADEESLAYSDAYGNAFLWDRDTTVRVAFADGFLSKKDSLFPIVSAHGKHQDKYQITIQCPFGHQGCMLFP
ncbi:MAG: hypothetical protein IJM65_07360 [Bacteroidales bacterium]|nr:hypothetical protein [Bacteroidales bacterium]